MGVVTKQDTFLNGMKNPSNAATLALRRTSDWVFSQDIPSDVTVDAGSVTFALHKFPLVSRCGWIRKLVAEAKDSDLTNIKLPDIPGGSEGFELAAKFCYGTSFDINAKNVAMLRCAAEYLEMSEDYGEGNLIARTEAFLNELVTNNLPNSVTVLRSCESLLPMAEELNIVSRCIDAAASKACREQKSSNLLHSGYSSSGRMDSNGSLSSDTNSQQRKSADWWAEELSVLRIDFYQRVLSAMRARGLRHDSLGGAIAHYAQQSLRGIIRKQSGRDTGTRTSFKVHDAATALEHEQRILVETIVSLLPEDTNAASISFLFGLLRTAIYLDTTIACRLDLERRIGMQLEQASLDDLLIPSYAYNGDTLFDVDTVHRIVVNFLQQEGKEDFDDPLKMYESDCSPPQSSMMKVAKLFDSFLAEIAPDANLSLAKFISLAELMPDYARVVDDGLYRAIDIYLKAHPALNDIERKRICSLMDCQKLSQEACTHAAQNERLPVQAVVQVLYFEQMRLRSAMAGSYADAEQGSQLSQRSGSGALSAALSPREDVVAVRRENKELKQEVARMKARLVNLEDDQDYGGKGETPIERKGAAAAAPPPPKPSFLQSVSKKLGKLNPFHRGGSKQDGSLGSSKAARTPELKASRRRRHSIS